MNNLEKFVLGLLRDRYETATEMCDLVGCIEASAGDIDIYIDYDFRDRKAMVEFYDKNGDTATPDFDAEMINNEIYNTMDGEVLRREWLSEYEREDEDSCFEFNLFFDPYE